MYKKCKNNDFIYIYDKEKILNKENVLNQTNVFHTSYYCKNNTCAFVDNEYTKPFIEFPDENETLLLYNTYTCTYDNAKLNSCPTFKCIDNVCLSVKCINNSECLSNKCFNNYCVFNDKNPIVHCDNIYENDKTSFMNCGKPYNDTCKSNEECSSIKCSIHGLCTMNDIILSKRDDDNVNNNTDNDVQGVTAKDITIIYIILIFIFIIIPISCCICYCVFPKSRIYNNN
ncbi:hypothetical protein BCR32DRAFT_243038 [Anaeromyces robustus]|uniref:Uncharacterized protein n=1 Tax=Anaeromyces robustus TaxID=1754192 RepID=A0A1Y1XDV5_9FUNG|nr:hypothetical protein BCR32DRAFT_243038 [Anaeromyces robustus]|eukprot:ORX83903.1 hypothetical protein BCR32DRAFT_243038 [Anaeromyces robustus]